MFITLMPEGADGGSGPRFNSALRTARAQLEQLGLQPEVYLDPIQELGQRLLEGPAPGPCAANPHGLAIFRSATQMTHFVVTYPIRDEVIVADRFYILPLLKALESEREFCLLALGQKRGRLIHCTEASSEEIALPPTMPTSLSDFTQTDQPDHRLENRQTAGQKGKPHGSHPGVTVAFGSASDAERKDEYLSHFYREVDKQLQPVLRANPLPLVVAGVDYEIALYHRVSEYPELVPDGARGAADGLKGGELHARALEAIEAYSQRRIDKALAQYEKAGRDRISHSIADIVKDAYDGRVLHLFLAEGAQQPGWFDETERVAHERTEDHRGDLLNLAAMQTLWHAGNVFVLQQERMPGQVRAAAMLRF